MMYAMDSWLEQLDDEVAPYVEPLLQISYIALDSPDARPQVKEMLLSACASAAAHYDREPQSSAGLASVRLRC